MNFADKRYHNGWVVCSSKRFPGKLYYFNVRTGETAWNVTETEFEQTTMNMSYIQRADRWNSYPEPNGPPPDDAWTPYRRPSYGNQIHCAFGQSIFPKYATNAGNYDSTMMWSPAPNQMIPMSPPTIPIDPRFMHMPSSPQTGPMPFQMGHMPFQGHMQSPMGHIPSQGHMQSQMGHMIPQMVFTSPMGPMTPQMDPMASQMGPSTSRMGQMTSQMGPSTSQMGPSTSQMGPTSLMDPRTSLMDPRTSLIDPRTSLMDPRTSLMDPRTAQMDPRTAQMGQMSRPACFKAPVYEPYKNFWSQEEPTAQPNVFDNNEGPKQWPSYIYQNTDETTQARSEYMPTRTHTMERQRGDILRNNECRPVNQRHAEPPKNVVIDHRQRPSRQTETMSRKISYREGNIGESSGLHRSKPVENLINNNKEGNNVNNQEYFGLQPKNATKFIPRHLKTMLYDDDTEFDVQVQKHPFAPSENSSTVSNEDLAPVKRRPLSLPIPKYDENIENILQSRSFKNITVLEDKASENQVKNKVASKSGSDNKIVMEPRVLDKNDLRFVLLAKQNKPGEASGSERKRKSEVRKIKTRYSDDHKPEPKKKRVTFSLDHDEQDPECEDQEMEDLDHIAVPNKLDDHAEYPIQHLRALGSVSNGQPWFVVVDTNVLIEEYDFVTELVSGDPSCVLLIPDAVRREIQVLSRGDHHGRTRVLGARSLTRKLANRPSYVTFQDANVDEMMMTEFSIDDSIIDCCLLVRNESHHVVFITNNQELHEKALDSEILSLNLNDIKKNATLENRNQIQSENEIDNEKTISSTFKKMKRIHEYSVEAQIKFNFKVKNKMIADRIASRMDEWMCTFTQIMEDALTELLQKNKELVSYHPPPWTLQEAIKYVAEVFAEDPNSPINTLVDKLTQTLPRRGPPSPDVSPHDFMKILGCGILLIKYLNSQQCSELNHAEDSLMKLLALIEEPVGRDHDDAMQVALVEEPVGRDDDEAMQVALGSHHAGASNLDNQERINYVKNPAEVAQRHFLACKGGKSENCQDGSKVIRAFGRNIKSLTINQTKSKDTRKVEDSYQSNNIDRQVTDNFYKESDHEQIKEDLIDDNNGNFEENRQAIESGPKLLKRLTMSSLGKVKSQAMKHIDIGKRETTMRQMTDMLDNILDQGKAKHLDSDSVIVNKHTHKENRITKDNSVKDVSEDQIDAYDRFEAFKRKQMELEAGINLPVKCFKNQYSEALEASNNKYEHWGPVAIQDKNIQQVEKCEKSTSSKDDSAKDSKSIEEPTKEPQASLVKTVLGPHVRRQIKIKKNDKKNIEQEPHNKGMTTRSKSKHIQELQITSNTKKDEKCNTKNTENNLQGNDLDALDYTEMEQGSDNKSDHPVYPKLDEIDNRSFGNTTESSRLVIAEDFDRSIQNNDTTNKHSKNTQSMNHLVKKSESDLKIFYMTIGRFLWDTIKFVQKHVAEFKDVKSVTEKKHVISNARKILDSLILIIDELQSFIAGKRKTKLMNVNDKQVSGGLIEKCLTQAVLIKGQLLYLLSLADGNFDVSLTSAASSVILPCNSDHMAK